MKNFGNIMWGIVLILLGVIIGTNVLGLTDINIFFDGWWTLFIIIPCLIELVKEREKTGSIIGILIGIILLLCCQNILDFETVWKLIIPVILIIIGISFIYKNIHDSKLNKEIKKLNQNKIKNGGYYASFSGQNINFDGEKFEGADLTAMFGSIKCDLRNAIIEKDVVINASSTFGGIDIYVPENVKIKIKSSSVFGGVDEKKKNNVESADIHTIYINATCIFGGIDIK